MLDAIAPDSEVTKNQYDAAIPQMRVDLVNAQYDLQSADFAVLINLAGDDRLGCEEIVDLLQDWMDGRYIDVHFHGEPSEEERERPYFWRYWRTLPPKGRIGIFFGDFVWQAIESRAHDEFAQDAFNDFLDHVKKFHTALVADGALVINLWLHLPKKELKRRLKKAKKNPTEHWKVHKVDWDILADYDSTLRICEDALDRTSSDSASWHVVDGTDKRHRNLTVAQIIHDAIIERLDGVRSAPAKKDGDGPVEATATDARPCVLSSTDLSLALERADYKKKLNRYQRKLNKLTLAAYEKGVSSVLVFEGWDAAGKGGVIRRLTAAISARDVRVVPIKGPTEEELARHYLWRFWRQLPRAGRMLIFDRSWYGRVLVERVEGLASREEWSRAYDEIVDFEAQLVQHGMLVRKFWLHIDPDEQLSRFKAREQTAFKKYKITEEDYRNREKWDDYVVAIEEMVARTSAERAPWILVPANNKPWARVATLKEVCRGLENLLDG
jgi:polyphosphate:AMP phosphotransferase